MEAEPMLTVKPISLADANRFVAEHHRHHIGSSLSWAAFVCLEKQTEIYEKGGME